MSLATTIHSLEAQRSKLIKEIAAVEHQLAAVAKALGKEALRKTAGATATRAAHKASRRRTPAKSVRHAWFARGEVAQLLRKVARKPKAPADVVREISALKGYERGLSQDDRLRFQTAAFMAVNHALKTGMLKRRRDGTVSAV